MSRSTAILLFLVIGLGVALLFATGVVQITQPPPGEPSLQLDTVPEPLVLSKATIAFTLPKGDDKDDDTRVDVRVTGSYNNELKSTIAVRAGFAGNQVFEDPGGPYQFDLEVAENVTKEKLADLVTTITMSPKGNDRWIFNYSLVLVFSNGEKLEQSKAGVILDQDNRTFTSGW